MWNILENGNIWKFLEVVDTKEKRTMTFNHTIQNIL